MKRFLVISAGMFLAVPLLVSTSFARNNMQSDLNDTCGTSYSCGFCHIDPGGGGPLTPEGDAYLTGGACAICPTEPACNTQGCSGYSDKTSCNNDITCTWSNKNKVCTDDPDACQPAGAEICDSGLDEDCDGAIDCSDSDCVSDPVCQFSSTCGDYTDKRPCNDDPGCEWIGNPRTGSCQAIVAECTPTANPPHDCNTWANYPADCLGCHDGGSGGSQFADVMNTTHYEWMGSALDMVNGGNTQGKIDTINDSAVNSYCINILGDWPVCGSCHVGRGVKPGTGEGKENVDCLVCHNDSYAGIRIRLPDGSLGPDPAQGGGTDSMVQNIAMPTRKNCLKCHANAGGGDGVKRGDLSMATITNTNASFDVHMNTNASNVLCQDCHTFINHKTIGRGSDLRPTDDTQRGSEIACATCHPGKDTTGHSTSKIDDHVARVACQTCHIPTYAKVATEIDRDWRIHHGGVDASTCDDNNPCPGHPETVKASNLKPEYLFWNRASDNALLGDSETVDPVTGCLPTSRPDGAIDGSGSKLYPFKYKTAQQPIISNGNVIIALDTFAYIKGNGSIDTAIANGLSNMGYPIDEPYTWGCTDTYQLLNHGIEPAANVLQCSDCHENTSQMDLPAMGYAPKKPMSDLCNDCHSLETGTFTDIHSRHVDSQGINCSSCHNFSRQAGE